MLKHIIFLFGYTTFVVVVWITANVVHNLNTSRLTSATQKQIIPIDATFDPEALDQLEKRTSIPVDLTREAAIIAEDSIPESSESAIVTEPELEP